MTTQTVNNPRTQEGGTRGSLPVVATDIIYEGSAVGIVKASGHARPLTSADRFAGFAEAQADNSAGAAADINVRTIKAGVMILSVTGAVITDVGAAVYAQDDNAFSFVKTAGVYIGRVSRYVSAGVAAVAFDVETDRDPFEGLAAETVDDNKTLDSEDSGKVFFVTVDAKAITLPAVEGMTFAVVNAGAYGAVAVNVSPNANDMIEGPDLAGTDNKDLINTKATANRGDSVKLEYADANGWMVSALTGVWAEEG